MSAQTGENRSRCTGRSASSAAATMASFTEFYLTTMWTYKPNVVKQVIDDLVGMGFTGAEFTYDSEYGWFKVTCLEEQAHEIRNKFGTLAREIEDNAFDTYEDDMLDMNDILRPSFDNEYFTQAPDATAPCKLDESTELYRLPGPLTKYSHGDLWDDLDKNNEPYIVDDLMSQSEFDQMQEDLSIEMTVRLGGKLVYIAGHSEDCVGRARERLRVMLAIRKLLPNCLRAQNLVYAEDYVNPAGAVVEDPREIRAEMRYLANIDPKLASSTLLDRLTVDNLEESYKIIYKQASSIRLCPWSPEKKWFVSLLGPKVSVKSRDKTMLGNRPEIFVRKIDKFAVPAKEPGPPTPPRTTQTASHVETWIANVQPHVGPVTDTAQSLLDAQAAGRSTPLPIDEDLIDFNDAPSKTYQGSGSGTVAGKPDTTLLDDDGPISSLHQDISALRVEPGTSDAETLLHHRLEDTLITGDDCLVDMLAAVADPIPENASKPSVSWQMASLIPVPTGDREDGDDTANSDILLSVLETSPRKGRNATSSHQTGQRRPQQATAADRRDSSRLSRCSSAQQSEKTQRTTQQAGCRNTPRFDARPTSPSNLDSNPGSFGPLLATKAFINEIEGAMARLLSTGPFRRGRVAARAEFGRIILEKAARNALAFNNDNTPSNPWVKPELIGTLNQDYGENQNIHFTNVLSTYAYDMEDMINMKANGSRLWEEKPSRAWTTYSFHCALRSTEKNIRHFIVDIENDGASDRGFSYSIRVPNDVGSYDKPMPVYIHAIRRHWDLRIVMFHVKPEEANRAYQSLAEALMQSLSISLTEKGLPELRFAVMHESAVNVTEVRVLTKWRHLSLDGKSALEITEVQQMEMVPCTDGVYSGSWDTWEGKLARPWSYKRTKDNRAKGEFPRWYEAAVLSLELDELCQQNACLQVGEKAEWDVQDLRVRGVLSTLYGPALHMVAQMDHVGRFDDNNLSRAHGHLLLRPNDNARHVPGSMSAQGGRGRGGGQQRGGRSQHKGARSDLSMSETLSAQVSTASGRGSSSRQNSGGPGRVQDSEFYQFW